MAKKVALLIGVSEYDEGIPSLPAPLNDVEAIKRVLENPHMGGFDEVKPLTDPDPTAILIVVIAVLLLRVGKAKVWGLTPNKNWVE